MKRSKTNVQHSIAFGLKVCRKDGEPTRRKLAELGILDNSRAIKSDSTHVYLPIITKDHPYLEGREIVEAEFKPREQKPGTLAESLGLKDIRSFDIIGDIAIIEIPDELRSMESEIGNMLLKLHKGVKAVFAKDSSVMGDYRVRGVRHIAGEHRTETIHKEHGCKFKVDVSKVYFSPRLSHERERILAQVKDGEHILALFSGVAPFPIIIAKERNVIAYSIELNPEGHKYALENARLNKVDGKVFPIHGDVREVLKDKRFISWADRIIMPLPKDALGFLPYVSHAAKSGCIIHVYGFAQKGKEQELCNQALALLGRPAEVIYARRVRTYSPDTDQFVIDIRVL
ncbi:MAG: class I SAM-dependent methyltransferase family protein [Candidatus Micrarchaeota archaeon]|nr:class I SAM-dependent methyltransferase family protein [Candidatus Micrarchaeota archaeon]